MKAQPLAYNKDNQEDKEPVFDTVDTVRSSVRAFADMVPHLLPNRDAMRQAAQKGFATATDLADYLVRKGVPFRDAHEIVGKAVRLAIQVNRDLAELPLEALRELSPKIDADVFAFLTVEGSIRARNHFGGTAPERVREAVTAARQALAEDSPTP
jgi:argininosuccinate lyase